MLARRAARRLGAGQRPVVAGHDTARVAPPAQIDALARVLMSAWEKAEHKPVTASYIATFADMARAALAAGYHQTPANQEDRDAFCHALSYPIADTMEAIGIEDVDLSDGRMLADAIYCLGYRIPAQEDTSV